MRASTAPRPCALRQMPAIQLLQQVELPALIVARQGRVADVLDQLVELGVLRVDVRALVGAGQEGRLPVLRRP